MYEANFGLKSSPFGSKAEGAEVFFGPQQAKITTNIHKGLSAQDAVVTVTGPVGVGKTTIVARALETITPGRMVAWVGRMPLSADEVVDLLLSGFGIQKQSNGTIQRFAAFRRLLAERASAGVPVTIVVEDAHRIGSDALAEIEALTASDTGDSAGANIILMGQPSLHDLLSEPDLARMKQRMRLRQDVGALSMAEVTGYLKHCIRQAGGDYDTIFEPGVADIVFGCSEGIPRVINTICATALATAAEENATCVTAVLMHKVAAEAFGYDGPIPETPAAPMAPLAVEKPAVVVPDETAPDATVKAEAQEESDTHWEKPVPAGVEKTEAAVAVEELAADSLPKAAWNVVVESGRYPETPASVEDVSPDTVAAEATQDIDDIPELSIDTHPKLNCLKVSDEADVPRLDSNREHEETTEEKSGDTPILKGLSESAVQIDDQPNANDPEDEAADEPDDGNFNFNAALSVETDATNVMEVVTPNLDKLASEAKDVAQAATKKAEAPAEVVTAENELPSFDDLPTLSDSMRLDVDKEVKRATHADTGSASEEDSSLKPKEPPSQTISEMTARISAINPDKRSNDVDALEAALEAAKNGDLASIVSASPMPAVSGANFEEALAELPEVTLDTESSAHPQHDEDLLLAAEEIGSADSLEDISDDMAETLFGSQAFNKIAAEVVANPPENHEMAQPPPDGPSPVKIDEQPALNAANDAIESLPELETSPEAVITEAPSIEPEIAVQAGTQTGSLEADSDEAVGKDSVALRIDMLNEMKSRFGDSSAEVVELGEDAPKDTRPKSEGSQPESIENQINTSITQSLEALNITKVADKIAANENEKKQKKSGGFFSRFRKSS